MGKKISVVGAGVGGLAAAARLAKDGFEVDVYEKLPQCGGRNHLLEDRGFKFDMGPSFVLMPDFFEEVFTYCGENIRDHLDLKALDINYKIFYPDGQVLTVHKDSEKTKDELERIEKGSAEAFDKFIREAGSIYKKVRPLLYRCFTARDLVNPVYWPLLPGIKALESYWGLARKFFKTDKLLFAFTFEAMFMGVSPFKAPAFYSIITYSDHVQKIFHPMGGMYKIPQALENMAKKYEAKFHYGLEINNVSSDNGKIRLKADFGEMITDKAVVNADFAYAQEKLLKRKIPKYQYSCSVYLIYLGLKKKIQGLAHHNLFFAKDLIANLNNIFKDKVISEDFSFYVHVPTVTDSSLAPKDKDIFYILIPVPNLEGNKESVEAKEKEIRKVVFDKINQTLGINLENEIELEHRFYPQDFITRYNIKNGATFGLAHNLMQSAFFRPANFDRRIKGLYYVGASSQPGGGLPVVIAGSRIVADLIKSGGF